MSAIKAVPSATHAGMLLFELGHNSRIVSLAGHQQPEHLLSVFTHDELQSWLMLLKGCPQLWEKESKERHYISPVMDIILLHYLLGHFKVAAGHQSDFCLAAIQVHSQGNLLVFSHQIFTHFIPLFSCCSSRICRFSCWIPITRVERGRCLATRLRASISSWYYVDLQP